MPTTKNAGLNRVYWDMKLKAPKTAGTPGLGPMLLSGPMVNEGAYIIRLTKGDKSYSGEISLVSDPLSDHSAEDRQLRQETVIGLYRMQENLAYLADSVADLEKQARAAQKVLPAVAKTLAASLQKFLAKLTDLHGLLVQSEGLFGEERLREKVMDLYTAVAGFGGRPTQAQLDYAGYLTVEMQKVQAQFDKILAAALPRLNRGLQEKGLPLLRLMRREEYSR